MGQWKKDLNRDLRRDGSRSTNTFFPDGTFRKRRRECKGFREEPYFGGVGKRKGREQGSGAEIQKVREGQEEGEVMPWAELGELSKS